MAQVVAAYWSATTGSVFSVSGMDLLHVLPLEKRTEVQETS